MWFWWAISASLLWGIGYVANQYLLRYFSPFEVLFLESVVLIISFTPFFLLRGGMNAMFLKLNNLKLTLILLVSCAIYMAAATLIYKSISASNASLAAIIEASYPMFTMVFAFLLLGEIQFTPQSLIGCGFILVGLVIMHF